MALTRVKTWITGEILTAGDLNTEIDNLLNSALSLISPLTNNLDFGAFRAIGLSLGTVGNPSVQFSGDADTGLYSSAANTVDVTTAGVLAAEFGASFILAAAPEDSRTATVDVLGILRSTTSGTPAAGIGTGLEFDAESADENPSVLGRLDFAFSDVTAGSEDSYLDVLLRIAGAAITTSYRLQATGTAKAIFTHANSADRTYTLPNTTGTVALVGSSLTWTTATADVTTSETTTSASYTNLATSGPAVTLSPGATQTHIIDVKGEMGNNTSGEEAFMSVAVGGAAAADADAAKGAADSANNVTRTESSFVFASSQINGATHTAKYKVSAGTGTFKQRRIAAWTVA